jgi:epoxyqueuosine reductase
MRITNDVINILALTAGFNLVGFASALPLDKEKEHLENWLSNGYNAGMDYMERNIDKKYNVKNLLPSAKSVISLALNYYTPGEYSHDNNFGKISRYAWGKDYHQVIWDKLNWMTDKLKSLDTSFEAISFVDSGPVMDKAWAVRSGLGWYGKNSNVLNRDWGSWFFIANIICNAEFNYTGLHKDYCGDCTACIDACPTGAIVQEYVVDANKCISYQTIENKGEISEELKARFEGWVFGCDICQDVCPWNKKFSIITDCQEFLPINKEISLEEIEEMKQNEFSARFKESPIKRTKLNGLKRNALFLKNLIEE